MNYRLVYIKIINKAKLKNRKKRQDIYYEKHHILPKSLFPNWIIKESNLVLLTAREHFFCHQLLDKIYPGKKMFLALWRLANDKKHIINSREFERLRIRYATEVLSKIGKITGPQNKGKKRTEEQRKRISEKTKEAMKKVDRSQLSRQKGKHWWTNGVDNVCSFDCPEGWHNGRSGVIWTDKFAGAQKYWKTHIRPTFNTDKVNKAWETKRKKQNNGKQAEFAQRVENLFE
jgi:hypothetical protein